VIPDRSIELAPLIERVAIGRVVIDAGDVAETGRRPRDEVRLGRMQIAARRVDAQRPACAAILLPRREPERVAQEIADARGFSRGVGPRSEQDFAPAAIRPEWIGLRGPVQIPEGRGESMEVMFRAVVILDGG